MESFRSCVMCRRGLHRARDQEHILSENLPRTRPELAAFIQENAVLEILKPSEKKAKYQYNGINSGRPATPQRSPPKKK